MQLINDWLQLRVTAARPGIVNFELDIQKEHTVSFFVQINLSR
jgi:hypothetical protein